MNPVRFSFSVAINFCGKQWKAWRMIRNETSTLLKRDVLYRHTIRSLNDQKTPYFFYYYFRSCSDQRRAGGRKAPLVECIDWRTDF